MKPFVVGDRVAVYGVIPAGLGQRTFDGWRATVVNVLKDGLVVVEGSTIDGNTHYTFHPKQCRRLRPKVEGRAKGEKRMERWAVFHDSIAGGVILSSTEEAADHNLKNCAAMHFFGAKKVHLFELRPGEVIVDRAKLAKIWDEWVYGKGSNIPSASSSKAFKELCTALGLPEAP